MAQPLTGKRWFQTIVACGAVGAALGGIFAYIALAFAGGGHGGYGPAKLFFPYTMLLTLEDDGVISDRLTALALIQFPAYGLFVGMATWNKYAAWLVICAIVFGHAVAVWFCFSTNLPFRNWR